MPDFAYCAECQRITPTTEEFCLACHKRIDPAAEVPKDLRDPLKQLQGIRTTHWCGECEKLTIPVLGDERRYLRGLSPLDLECGKCEVLLVDDETDIYENLMDTWKERWARAKDLGKKFAGKGDEDGEGGGDDGIDDWSGGEGDGDGGKGKKKKGKKDKKAGKDKGGDEEDDTSPYSSAAAKASGEGPAPILDREDLRLWEVYHIYEYAGAKLAEARALYAAGQGAPVKGTWLWIGETPAFFTGDGETLRPTDADRDPVWIKSMEGITKYLERCLRKGELKEAVELWAAGLPRNEDGVWFLEEIGNKKMARKMKKRSVLAKDGDVERDEGDEGEDRERGEGPEREWKEEAAPRSGEGARGEGQQTHPCPTCGKDLRWVKEYEKWWCDGCQKYIEGDKKGGFFGKLFKGKGDKGGKQTYPCKTCGADLEYVEEYKKWYCRKCEKYAD